MTRRPDRPEGLIVVIAALLLGSAAIASSPAELRNEATGLSDRDEIERLRSTVERLANRVAELEQADGERWLSEERAAQIREVVTDVLADASTRSSFQSEAALAGYAPGKGFYLESADGNYSLRFAG